MKKNLLLLAALVTAVLLCVTVFAENNIGSTDSTPVGSTEISAEVSASYIVTIPDNTTIAYGAEQTALGTVSASELRLFPGSYLSVEMTSSGCLVNAANEESMIPYTFVITDETEEELEEPAYTFRLDKDTKTAETVSVKITEEAWEAADAGSYTDTITFTVTCVTDAA